MLFHADDVRDDLARLFHDHHVADADVLAFDFFGIVQAGPADRGAGQLDRLQVGHRRDRPVLPTCTRMSLTLVVPSYFSNL